MSKKRSRANTFLAVSICSSLLALGVSYQTVFYEDTVYICSNTGSLKGHREWFTGYKTDYWREDSALDLYVQTNHAVLSKNDWQFSSRTGKNGFGNSIMFGCGSSWPTIIITGDRLSYWIENSSNDEIMSLYDTLLLGDRMLTNQQLTEMREQGLIF